jgi:hypothetical protein
LGSVPSVPEFVPTASQLPTLRSGGTSDTALRLLGNPKVFAKFIAGDSVLAIHHKPDDGKPLLKRYWRIFKDGASTSTTN